MDTIKHLGDITKINGAKAPVVDTIIFGAPCQDLSVAGLRKGMRHGDLGDEEATRSGLFMDAVRIIKEMRYEDERNGRTGVDIRPRYGIYENVCGAFSSNRGQDFRIVLEELAKVKDKNAVIPMPESGKWTNYGCIVGDGWSIAWRVLDAQFWGVPQRRRRIALVADFGGQSAPEILFVRKSLSGDTDESEQKRKETSPDVAGGIGADDSERVFCNEPGAAKRLGGYVWEDLAPTLRTEVGDNRPSVAYGISSYDSNAMKSSNPNSGFYEADTSRTLDGNGGNPACNQGGIAIVESVAYTMQAREGCAGGGKGALFQKDRSAALRTVNSQYVFQPVYSVENHPNDSRVGINEDGKANTLNAFDVGDVRTTEAVVYALDRASFNQGKNASYDFEISDKGVNSPIVAKGPSAVCYSVDQGGGKSGVDVREGKAPTLTTTHDGSPAVCYGINGDKAGTLDSSYFKGCGMRSGVEREVVAVPVKTRYIVRRLTPCECEALQGFPKNWTDIGEWVDSNGKKRQTSDAARYRALGNSISLPNWKWVLKRICACYERDATMASLFSGIGGFDLLWTQLNGMGSVLWESEIEEFPSAVCKRHFGDEETGEQGDFYEFFN